MTEKNTMTFLSQKGFVWGPSPSIYGGVSGFYDYGPNGKLLKNRIENNIRKIFTKGGFWEVECPIVSPEAVWKASGHAGNFSDPLIKSASGQSFRADKLIEDKFPDVNAGAMSDDELLAFIEDKKMVAPDGKDFVPEIKRHILMMETTIGLDQKCYNRPETATATYIPFPNYLEHFRGKVPFGVFQIGKAFRNEISPRQGLLRLREFTQAEGQFFIHPDEKNNFPAFSKISNVEMPIWSAKNQEEGSKPELVSIGSVVKNNQIKTEAYAWALHLAYELFRSFGFENDVIRVRQHLDNEKAFYADDAWDIEIKTESHGWIEVCGVHDRTDYDLNQHAKHSKTKLEAKDLENNSFVPHVLEIAFGVDRPLYCLVENYYDKKEKDEGKSVLRLPYHISPIQLAVLPLMNKQPIMEKAQLIHDELVSTYTCYWDRSGAIGKRYLRQDEIGTPFCLTIDFDTVEKDLVTIRDRDSAKQIQFDLSKLDEVLFHLINGKKTIDDYSDWLKQ